MWAWSGCGGVGGAWKGCLRVLGMLWSLWAGSGGRFPLFVDLLSKCIFITLLGHFPSNLGVECGHGRGLGALVGFGRGVGVF